MKLHIKEHKDDECHKSSGFKLEVSYSKQDFYVQLLNSYLMYNPGLLLLCM